LPFEAILEKPKKELLNKRENQPLMMLAIGRLRLSKVHAINNLGLGEAKVIFDQSASTLLRSSKKEIIEDARARIEAPAQSYPWEVIQNCTS
jgi:hypothetical protein